MGYIAENRTIRNALYRLASANEWIELREGISAESVTRETARAVLTLSDGNSIATPLVVVAEGRASKLRAQAGIRITERDYGQTAIVATIAHEKPHLNVAQERFYPAGPFAILPMVPPQDVVLPFAHCSSIVWTEHRRFGARFAGLPDAEFLLEVKRRFGDFLGEIAVVKPIFSYPLSNMLVSHMAEGRLVLVGDSAHRIHPIAGQGLNLGLRDAMELAKLVGDQAANGLDIGYDAMLAAYEAARRFDVQSMSGFTHHLNGLFASDDALLRTGRRLGMGLVEKLPPIKKLMMRRAMGF
jgi:2-octaprenyl-6-methoxyphenol hydroxylase